MIYCNCGYGESEDKWIRLEMFNGQEVFSKQYDSKNEKIILEKVELITCPKCKTIKLY